MEKGINLKTVEFKQKMIEIINESNLPPILVSYVLHEISGEVSMITNNTLQKEELEYKKSIEEKREIGEKEDDKCNESV